MGLPIPNDMERPEKTNKDSVAIIATRLLFENNLMLKDSKKNTGLNCGSKKVTALGNYATSQVTVSSNSNTSKIIGSNNYLMNSLIILNTNI